MKVAILSATMQVFALVHCTCHGIMKNGDKNKHTFIVHNEKGGSYTDIEDLVKTLSNYPNVIVAVIADMCRKSLEIEEKGAYTSPPAKGQFHIVYAC